MYHMMGHTAKFLPLCDALFGKLKLVLDEMVPVHSHARSAPFDTGNTERAFFLLWTNRAQKIDQFRVSREVSHAIYGRALDTFIGFLASSDAMTA